MFSINELVCPFSFVLLQFMASDITPLVHVFELNSFTCTCKFEDCNEILKFQFTEKKSFQSMLE
jgi:hypothetical protein